MWSDAEKHYRKDIGEGGGEESVKALGRTNIEMHYTYIFYVQ
jgi:hypothetical protein